MPVLFVKNTRKIRLYINYKIFNATTAKNKYLLFLIQTFFNRLAKIKYFTKLGRCGCFQKKG